MTRTRTPVFRLGGSNRGPRSWRFRRRSPVAAACLTALLLATGTGGCGDPPVPPAQVLRPVRTLRVARASQDRPRTYSGVAQASVESSLSFRVAGTIVDLPTHVGDRIRADALIAQLDRTDYELEL